MRRLKRVPFLMQFNGPRVIGPVRIDVAGIALASTIFSWSAFTLASFKVWVSIILTFLIAFTSVKLYKIAKDKSSNGYLWHLFYNSGIWSVKKNPKKYEELNRMDIKNYFPDSTITHFKD